MELVGVVLARKHVGRVDAPGRAVVGLDSFIGSSFETRAKDRIADETTRGRRRLSQGHRCRAGTGSPVPVAPVSVGVAPSSHYASRAERPGPR